MSLDRFDRYNRQVDPSSLQVVVGKHELKRHETTQSTHKIAKFYVHAKYSNITNDYDIENTSITVLVCRVNRPKDLSFLQVVVGKHTLKLHETTQSTHKIAKIYMHAKYSGIDYDIALLKLTTAINFTREVSPVCLPKKDVWDKMCVTTGWGLTQGE